MVKVRLTQGLIGSPARKAGELITVDEAEAKRLIAAGIAIAVKQDKRTATKRMGKVEKRGLQGNN